LLIDNSKDFSIIVTGFVYRRFYKVNLCQTILKG